MSQVYENNIWGGEFRACSSAYVKTRIGGERYKFKLGFLCKRPCEHVYFHVLWVSRSFTLSAQLLLKYLKVILLEYIVFRRCLTKFRAMIFAARRQPLGCAERLVFDTRVS